MRHHAGHFNLGDHQRFSVDFGPETFRVPPSSSSSSSSFHLSILPFIFPFLWFLSIHFPPFFSSFPFIPSSKLSPSSSFPSFLLLTNHPERAYHDPEEATRWISYPPERTAANPHPGGLSGNGWIPLPRRHRWRSALLILTTCQVDHQFCLLPFLPDVATYDFWEADPPCVELGLCPAPSPTDGYLSYAERNMFFMINMARMGILHTHLLISLIS